MLVCALTYKRMVQELLLQHIVMKVLRLELHFCREVSAMPYLHVIFLHVM